MMSFRTILVSLLFVAMTKSHPIAYSAYDEKESSQNHTPLVLLVDRHNPEMENEMFDSGSDPGSTVIREKRIGSLSIVNSLDVLRQRVLLELARRKALQDQRQIDANRRILESIGKRTYYNDSLNKADGPVSEFGYVLDQEKDDDRNATPEGFTDRVQNWLRAADSSFRENQLDDQTRAVQTNEVRLL